MLLSAFTYQSLEIILDIKTDMFTNGVIRDKLSNGLPHID